MKVYLAALFSRRAEMEQHADLIKDYGHEVTARWVYGGEEGLTREQIALLDLEDVDRADIVLSFTHPNGTATKGGGRHVEFGYALAKGKQVVLIGDRENVFHDHPKVTVFPSLVDWLRLNVPRITPAPSVKKMPGPTLPVKRHLPTGSADRKQFPMCTGLLDYFPDALAEVAHISYLGNQKHNPGQPTHWARGKSMDHADCCIRHLTEHGFRDIDGNRHTAQLAWRALALLQEELEAEEGYSIPRGAKSD